MRGNSPVSCAMINQAVPGLEDQCTSQVSLMSDDYVCVSLHQRGGPPAGRYVYAAAVQRPLPLLSAPERVLACCALLSLYRPPPPRPSCAHSSSRSLWLPCDLRDRQAGRQATSALYRRCTAMQGPRCRSARVVAV